VNLSLEIAEAAFSLIEAAELVPAGDLHRMGPDPDRFLNSLTRSPALGIGIGHIRLDDSGRLLQWTGLTFLLVLPASGPDDSPWSHAANVERMLDVIYQNHGELRSAEGAYLSHALTRFETIGLEARTVRNEDILAITFAAEFATDWRKARQVVI
jgi:hypothetical protein